MNAHFKISFAFEDVRGSRLWIISDLKHVSILRGTCKKLLELDVKEVSKPNYDVRHGMHSGLSLILHNYKHSWLSV